MEGRRSSEVGKHGEEPGNGRKVGEGRRRGRLKAKQIVQWLAAGAQHPLISGFKCSLPVLSRLVWVRQESVGDDQQWTNKGQRRLPCCAQQGQGGCEDGEVWRLHGQS